MVDTATQAAPATPAQAPALIPSPPLGGSPNQAQVLQDQRAPQRANLLDGLRGLRSGSETPPAEPTTAPTAAPTTAQTPVAAATVDPAQTPAPAAVAAAPAEPPKTVESTPAEPAEPPGMAQVRKAEQHMRARLADERAQMLHELDRQKATWVQQVSELDKYKTLLSNARQDPMALLAAAGFGDADYEPLAQLAYAMSPEGQKDPRVAQGRKIAAHESLARRSQQSEQEKIRSELQQLRDEQTRRDTEAAAQANVQRYLSTVTRTIGDATPHVRYASGRAPEATQQQLLSIADRLYTESGPSNDLREVPTPEQVLKAYEHDRISHIRDVLSELHALGIDPAAFGKAPAAPAATQAPAAAAQVAPAAQLAAAPAPTAAQAATPAPITPPAAQTEDQKRAAALEELRKLRFAG